MTPIENFAYHPDPVVNELATVLLEELKRQEDVVGIFLSGSTAIGGRDRYSDVDVSLVVENKSAFKKRLPAIIERKVDLLFSFEPDFLLADFFIFYLQAGYKFDFYLFHPKDSMQTSLSEHAFIVMDTDDLLARKQANGSKHPIQNRLEEKYLSMALADIWALRREVYRKNIFEARYNLDDARQCIATYINLAHGHHYFGFDKFDSFLNEFLAHEMTRSLQDNDSFVGIIRAGLCLLNVVAACDYFETAVIDTTRQELKSILHAISGGQRLSGRYVGGSISA